MPRSRNPTRFSSEPRSVSSSSTSPERAADDDTDFFMAQANDSQSSIGIGNFRGLSVQNARNAVFPPIARLPPEILISIFQRFSAPSDWLHCMLVCRGWAATCVGLLWHRPSCNNWDRLKNVAASVGKPDSLFPYSDLVKRLNFSALMKDVSDGTMVPFAQCKRVERLTLTDCSKLTDKGVSDLVEGNRHVQVLDFANLRSITDHTIYTVARNCPRLHGLNIAGCVKVTNDSLLMLLQNCRHLRRLKLNGLTQLTDKSILSVAENCPVIMEIDLSGCKRLESASITTLLLTLRNLRELRLGHCAEIDDSAFLNLPDNACLGHLRILDLTACEGVGDAAVERIIAVAPRLRHLVLAKCKHITDRAVLAICKLGKSLHFIHFGHCSNITDRAVSQLVKSCNRIRYIDLACCSRITDDSVEQLASLPKLRRVGLVKCQAITNRSIWALANPKPSHYGVQADGAPGAQPRLQSSLERVHLSYCLNLTMMGIHLLLNHCPRLNHLSLTGVQAFLREDITEFCRPAPQEFTQQQREVFCVFSNEGVTRLRDYLNSKTPLPPPEDAEATMYDDDDDDDEFDEDEDHATGLMHAVALHDEVFIDSENATHA